MKNKNGFTLVELLVAIGIVATLATMLLASLTASRAKARDSKRISDVQQMSQAVQIFQIDYARSPEGLPELVNTGYLRSLPTDPFNEESYTYRYSACGDVSTERFVVSARLERSNAVLTTDIDEDPCGVPCMDSLLYYCAGYITPLD